MSNTEHQFDVVTESCKTVFRKKTIDYGTAWRVLRTISVVDQVFIKALRIRNIQNIQQQMIDDDISSEFTGIINYGLIGLIQLEINNPMVEELSTDKAVKLFEAVVLLAKETMISKNNDYGEAWREMSQESFVDLILMKLLRIRQILSNDGRTLISEGIDANYIDIIKLCSVCAYIN